MRDFDLGRGTLGKGQEGPLAAKQGTNGKDLWTAEKAWDRPGRTAGGSGTGIRPAIPPVAAVRGADTEREPVPRAGHVERGDGELYALPGAWRGVHRATDTGRPGEVPAGELEDRRALRGEDRLPAGALARGAILAKLTAVLSTRAILAAGGGCLPMDLASLESRIDAELRRFALAALNGRKEDLATASENLIELAERLGIRATRGADDTVEARRMDPAELMAGVEECLGVLPQEVAEPFRARIANLNRTRGLATR